MCVYVCLAINRLLNNRVLNMGIYTEDGREVHAVFM